MSHHVSASPSNPTGAVEVVRTSSSAATTAPVDTGSVATSSQPISTAVGGSAAPAAGLSGTPGANLPVPDIEQASSSIQGARADLSRTAGAERRLDGFDLVGGGGGGGGGGGAEAGVADEGATDAVAAATDGEGGIVDETGRGGARMEMGEAAELTSTAELGSDQAAVGQLTNQQLDTADAITATGVGQGAVDGVGAGAQPQTDVRADDVIRKA
jgi:hypothetical protein